MTMKTRGSTTVALVSLLALGGLTIGGRFWAIDHVARWTGRHDLGFVTCTHCHGERLENMPWAKPRPHHAAPAGLAALPHRTRAHIYIVAFAECSAYPNHTP